MLFVLHKYHVCCILTMCTTTHEVMLEYCFNTHFSKQHALQQTTHTSANNTTWFFVVQYMHANMIGKYIYITAERSPSQVLGQCFTVIIDQNFKLHYGLTCMDLFSGIK